MTEINNFKSIAIVELNYHQSVLYSLCNLFDQSDFVVTIFTTKKNYDEISDLVDKNRFDWVVYPKKTSIKTFLINNVARLNQHDIIFFNTLDCEIEYVSSLNLSPVKILRIHNTNTFLNRAGNLDSSLKWRHLLWFLLFKIWLPRRHRYLDAFLKDVDLVLLPDEPLADYIKDNNLDYSLSSVGVLPLSFFQRSLSNIDEFCEHINERQIAIPGIIDPARKDYDILADTLLKLRDEIEEEVQILFLGGTTSFSHESIIHRFKSIENHVLKISISKEWIPQNEFMDSISKSGFMISPAKMETTFKIFKEEYGKTKMSGSVSDVVRYGKPLILPKRYKLNDILARHVDQFDTSDELLELILRYLDRTFLIKKHKHLWNDLTEYSVENSLKKFNSLIANI